MRYRTAVISVMLILTLVLAGAGAVKAVGQKVVVSEELVWSEYSGFWSIFGDKINKITYSDGSFDYQYVYFSSPQKAEIYAVQPINIAPYQDVPVNMMLKGVSCSLGSGGTHDHIIDFYFGDGSARKFVGQVTNPVRCEQYSNGVFSIPNSYFGGAINTPGTYILGMEESVNVAGMVMKLTNTFRYFTITASLNPTPTSSPSTSGSYIKVTSNVGGTVYIDGTMSGMTGNTFTVSPGGHTVKVTQSGYNDYITSVTVDYGATATVSASLSPYNPTPTSTPGPGQCRDSYGNIYYCGTPTPTPTSTSNPCSGGYISRVGICAPSIQPPSTAPSINIPQIVQQLLSWLFSAFGSLAITGATDVPVGSGPQNFIITTTATEAPDTNYEDSTYNELWGTWMAVDKNQNIIAQKGSWVKLTGSTYSDSATVTLPVQGTYVVAAVVVKVPYTYTGTAWNKGTETIIGQDKITVNVKTPAPPASSNPTPPATSMRSILSSIWDWLRSWLPW